ncbi:MAG: hypothetical protein LPJ89_04270 [Hymenobacteraceae bacterium]|nr:hypothetical protein [Hymenobacteraceae bacterium]MDX5396276.1 hypothetical protein [Hymenobacteraceae bacterium]MDX5442980.1 hypothetical protein [Hymenobacteraceae bacterium]MDX5512337.1 hypothetical protein [Hymenobacteraceae bacterium]
MKLYHQVIELHYQEADQLMLAIHDWLERNVIHHPPGAPRLTVQELLSIRYLHRLSNRLARRSATASQKRQVKPIKFSFTVEEIFAVRTCIRSRPGDFLLQKVLGAIQQKSLNYDYMIDINGL